MKSLFSALIIATATLSTVASVDCFQDEAQIIGYVVEKKECLVKINDFVSYSGHYFCPISEEVLVENFVKLNDRQCKDATVGDDIYGVVVLKDGEFTLEN